MQSTRGGGRWNAGALAVASSWVLILGVLVLTPQPQTGPDQATRHFSACLICGDRGLSDAILNFAAFVPLGILLRPARLAVIWPVAIGLALSVSVEFAQLFIPGRYSNLGDVVWNTLGVWAGGLLWVSRARWVSTHHTARLRMAAILVASSLTLAFGWVMKPDWPVGAYWGQWTPELGNMERYRGSVVWARLDSIPIPPGRFPHGSYPRQMLTQEWAIETLITKGPPPKALSPIVNIYDSRRREVTMLGAHEEDLVYRERKRARDLRLDQPDLRLFGIMRNTAEGDSAYVGVVRRGTARCLSFNARESCMRFTPGRAWSLLFYPDDMSDRLGLGLDVVWLSLLLLPIGFWSERRIDLGVAGAATGLLMTLAVSITGLGPPRLSELLGAGCALILGHLLRRLVVSSDGIAHVPNRGEMASGD